MANWREVHVVQRWLGPDGSLETMINFDSPSRIEPVEDGERTLILWESSQMQVVVEEPYSVVKGWLG